jgi:hypothetical protein
MTDTTPEAALIAALRNALTIERVTEILRAARVPLHGHEIAVENQADYVRATVLASLYAALPPGWCGHEAAGEHNPGDHHQYQITCEICGIRGTIRLSVDPETAIAPESPR